MKILQVIHKPQRRGAEIFASQLSQHLIDSGHQVKIVALYHGEADLPFSDEIICLGTKSIIPDIRLWRRLNNLIKDFCPDIVQTNAGDTLKNTVFSKLIFRWKAPIVNRSASMVSSYLKSPLQRSLNMVLYRNVDSVIAVSKASKEDLLKLFPFLKSKIVVLPVGLEKNSELEAKIFKFPGEANIIHIGGFSFEKNHRGVIRIFRLVLNECPDAKLHLVGDGPLRSDIEKFVQKEGMADKIFFHGFVPDPINYLKESDILVLPSIIEGLPGVLLEAMYSKIPVVAYDVGGVSEIINSDTGTIIPKGDEKAFAREVVKNLREPDLKHIENAYKLVTQAFMNHQIATEFVEIYDRVIAKK